MKFNLVLIPDSKTAGALVELAEAIKKKYQLKTEFLLKQQGSIPHISVFQFEIEDRFLSQPFEQKEWETFLTPVWQYVIEAWEEILKENEIQPLTCSLPQRINIKHDNAGIFAGISWVEIVLDKEQNLWLQSFHNKLLEKLVLLNIKPLNASGDQYNPHFTLFNVKTDSLDNLDLLTQEIPAFLSEKLVSFSAKPVLGRANKSWELVKKLKEYRELNIQYETKEILAKL